MDIAAVGSAMKAMQVQSQIDIAVLDTALESQSELATQMIETLMSAPSATGHIDIQI